MYRLIVWGLGTQYNNCINLLRFFEGIDQISICAVTDRTIYLYSYVDGYPVIKKSEIDQIEYDYILVCSDDHFFDIYNEATREYGIDGDKILSYKILFIPYFSFDRYIKLHNRRISIISNNCWGGIICNSLHMECRSPFKNLSLSDEHYIKLLSDFDHYMCIDPIFNGKASYDSHIEKVVPVLEIDDIDIKENHELNPNRAISDWIRRRNKINRSEIIFEMYTIDRKVEELFYKVTEGAENRICFVPYESEFSNSINLSVFLNNKEFYEAVNDSAFLKNPSLNVFDLFEGKEFTTRFN